MNWQFEKISYFYLLLFIPFLVWRLLFLLKWKRSKINQFAEPQLQKIIFGTIGFSKFTLSNIGIICAFVLMVFGLANFFGGSEKKEVKIEGIDLVFVIDVSKSMNAEDVAPSRMEKAKKIISDFLSILGGDRVGIVAFAGNAYPIMPLSKDYGVAELYLNELGTNFITTQGTNIADAVLEASYMLSHTSNTSKAILLISDGEAHEGEIKRAINTANKNKISIFSVGIGTSQGAPIPLFYEGSRYSEYKKDENGDIVLTKLQDSTLKQLAKGTGGQYFYGGRNTKDVVTRLFKTMSTLDRTDQSMSINYDSKQYFQYFIGGALLLIFIVSLTNYKRDFMV
ncbi:MAG: VWA domain-containing protein [Apibacter sp.]|uniref:VWA domain-containing protein n=1 Tax=Apibacter sp. TaxID=2023709 RepID=UPI0025F66C36|nr:VWA domain-containing protein [Apibacter sp.]MCT6868931.1 VWA domain-containing protein [Apibacter sp.]